MLSAVSAATRLSRNELKFLLEIRVEESRSLSHRERGGVRG
jgi:hypothetical protein